MHTSTVLQSGLQEAQPPGGGSGINQKKTPRNRAQQQVARTSQSQHSHSTATVTAQLQSPSQHSHSTSPYLAGKCHEVG